MATTPVPTPVTPVPAAKPAAPAPVSLVTTIEKDATWVKAHVIAVLLAVALIAGSIIGGVSLFEDLIERHDARVAAAQQKAEGVDTATQQALLAQLTQDRAADAARDAVQTTLIQSLVAQMAQQRAATAKQVATDSTLDAQTAAARLAAQTKTDPATITVSGSLVTLPLPLTRTVVADLDLLPQAQSDVTNLQAQLTAQQVITTDAKSELFTANDIIAADKNELVATVKADNAACDVRVDAQAKKDRKKGLWASVAGFVGGLVVRSLL